MKAVVMLGTSQVQLNLVLYIAPTLRMSGFIAPTRAGTPTLPLSWPRHAARLVVLARSS